MNRKISVFILLILLASSFKYRAKTVESKESIIEQSGESTHAQISSSDNGASFDAFMVRLHEANQELVSGNPESFKALWAKNEDVSTMGVEGDSDQNKWETVAVSLGKSSKTGSGGSEYSYENITTEVGADLACLLQTEHYKKRGEKPVDLHVTILCRKEADGWKIVHRQAENIKVK
jgi:hypothetical protein